MRARSAVIFLGLQFALGGIPAAAGGAPDSAAQPAPQRVRFSGELRARFEAPTALDFSEGKNDLYVLTRIRLGALITVRPWLRFFGEWQDARGLGYNPPAPGSITNRLDLRQAYVEAGTWENSGWGLRLGRQALKFGKGRLVWDPDWSNSGRTFDALLVSASGHKLRMSAFAASVVTPRDRRFDRSDTSQMFYGLYGSARMRRGLVVEPYVFRKSLALVRNELGVRGALDLYTSGMRAAGQFGRGAEWEVETAWERGRCAGGPVRAWGGV